MNNCTCKVKRSKLAESNLLIVTRCGCGAFWIEPKDFEAYQAVGDEIELCRIVSALSESIRVRSESVYA